MHAWSFVWWHWQLDVLVVAIHTWDGRHRQPLWASMLQCRSRVLLNLPGLSNAYAHGFLWPRWESSRQSSRCVYVHVTCAGFSYVHQAARRLLLYACMDHGCLSVNNTSTMQQCTIDLGLGTELNGQSSIFLLISSENGVRTYTQGVFSSRKFLALATVALSFVFVN
jgi:hypothetical protein